MAYNLPPPWDPGYALPQNARDEGLERRAFVTKWMPRGTYYQSTVGDGGYDVPQYVRDEGYGQGAFTTKWQPQGTYNGPRVPHWLNRRPIMLADRRGAGKRTITMAAPAISRPNPDKGAAMALHGLGGLGGISGDAPMPEPFETFGQRAADEVIRRAALLPPGKRGTAVKRALDKIDPTLWSRTQTIAARYNRQGMNQVDAFRAGLARAMSTGIVAELTLRGQGKKPFPPLSGCCGYLSGMGGLSGRAAMGGSTAPMAMGATSGLWTNVIGKVIQTVTASGPILQELPQGWPYQGSAGETVLVISDNVTSAGGAARTLPQPLTFPASGGAIPLMSLPAAYQYIVHDLDVASTFFEGTTARGPRTSGGCPQGTRWSLDGISLQGVIPGLNPPTVDGGHPVPFLEALLTDPQTMQFPIPVCRDPQGMTVDECQRASCQGYLAAVYSPGQPGISNATCTTPGIPLYVFLYPNTSDTWGIFLTTTKLEVDKSADTYVPPAWRDKAGSIPAREVARNLFLVARQLSANEVTDYNSRVAFARANTGCTFNPFADFGDIGKLLKGSLNILKDLGEAIAGAACGALTAPGAAGAAAAAGTAAAGPKGGLAAGGAAGLLGAACGGQQMPPMPPPRGSPLMPILLLGGGALLVIALAKRKNRKKAAMAAGGTTK